MVIKCCKECKMEYNFTNCSLLCPSCKKYTFDNLGGDNSNIGLFRRLCRNYDRAKLKREMGK